MDWLNYHHLLYFWTVAREGSISRAAKKLHLSQPTISGQLRQLEQAIGSKLYERAGRGLRLTDTGKLVYSYADDIFSTGQELMERLRGDAGARRLSFVVGVPDVLPKLITYRLLEPVFSLEESVQLVCHEGSLPELLADLALHKLDLVLSDSPVGSQVHVRAYNHSLGESGVSWVAPQKTAQRLSTGYPESLAGQPLLLPTQNTILRRSVEQWLDKQTFDPVIAAEVEDSALLKILATHGRGIAPVANAILGDVGHQYGLAPIGSLDGVLMHFYAISVERKIAHPAVSAIAADAKTKLFVKDRS